MENTIFAFECASGNVGDIIDIIKYNDDIDISIGMFYAYAEKNLPVIKCLVSLGGARSAMISDIEEDYEYKNYLKNLIYTQFI